MGDPVTVVITGASGLLGRAVFSELKRNGGWNVIGLSYSRPGPGLRPVDLTNEQHIIDMFGEIRPQIVIHCAAERRPDVVEKNQERAKLLNETSVSIIAREAVKYGTWVLFISTDYVFDGRQPPYDESAIPNPLNAYGASKYQGETSTLHGNSDNAVLRVPILYGPVERLDESAVLVMYPQIANSDVPFKTSDYEQRYPTHVEDIATACSLLCTRKAEKEEIRGVYHWSGNEQMTRYTMSLAMARAMGVSSEHITGVKEPVAGAARPVDAHLSCYRLLQLGLTLRHPSFEASVAACLQPHIS